MQAIICLKSYAVNHDGLYPDGPVSNLKTANAAFRELFKEPIVTDERIFTSPFSIFKPDNLMGTPPEFAETLMPGENHWMLLKHQKDTSHPKMPIVIENSLIASWPPRWDTTNGSFFGWWHGMRTAKGRCWPDGTVTVGRNDGSVAVELLGPDGTLDWHSKNNLGPDGKSWIDTLSPDQIAKLSYWDIEEK